MRRRWKALVVVAAVVGAVGWLLPKTIKFWTGVGLVVSVDRTCGFESVVVDGERLDLEGANWVHIYPGTNTIEAKMPRGASQVTTFEMPKREQYGVISCNPLGIDMSD